MREPSNKSSLGKEEPYGYEFIMMEILNKTIKSIKNSKAVDISEVGSEVIKFIGERGRGELHKILNLCWR